MKKLRELAAKDAAILTEKQMKDVKGGVLPFEQGGGGGKTEDTSFCNMSCTTNNDCGGACPKCLSNGTLGKYCYRQSAWEFVPQL